MKKYFLHSWLFLTLALGINQSVFAHIQYFDISNVGDAGYYDVFTNYGYQQGTTPQLATTDDVNWYSFSLSQPADITLKLASTDISNPTQPALTAPAFSLYKGLFVTMSYDINPLISLPNVPNARGLVNTTTDFSLTTQPQDGDPAANLRTINYLTNATDGGTGTAELVNYHLAAGDYSVIASGNNALLPANDGQLIYGATISLTSVPVPGALWLMVSALASLRLVGRRQKLITAAA